MVDEEVSVAEEVGLFKGGRVEGRGCGEKEGQLGYQGFSLIGAETFRGRRQGLGI